MTMSDIQLQKNRERFLIRWDTDVHSTSQSEGSTMVADYHGRCLRRALDHKVRKLRTTLVVDEDVTNELDKIVCRLMTLALRTSRGRQNPPPSRWMQCKLLDLLTLTDKAIERRKRHFIDTYPLKAIGYDAGDKSEEMIALEKFRDDNTAKKIVDKYCHLVKSTDNVGNEEDLMPAKYMYSDLILDDNLSVTSSEFSKEIENIDIPSPSLNDSEPIYTGNVYVPSIVVKEETKLERTQAWVEEDIEAVPYPNHDINIDNSSGGTDHSTSNTKKSKRHKGISSKNICEMSILCKRPRSKHQKDDDDEKTKNKGRNSRLIKKVTRKNSSYNNLVRMGSYKYFSAENESYETKPRIKKERQRSGPSKPIPESLMDLCHPELTTKNNIIEFQLPVVDNCYNDNTVIVTQANYNVATTEDSFFIDIVMDGMEETIALRRTIGTDADVDPTNSENETLIRSVSEEIKLDSFNEKSIVITENVQSQTIFLNDINEPSTSKGIRHVSMDVQCGPDVMTPTHAMLSATTSLTRMPKIFVSGIKIGDSCTNVNLKNSIDFGTNMDNNSDFYKTIIPRIRSVGVRIRDSEANICNKIECLSMTQVALESPTMNDDIIINVETKETKLIKPVSSASKIEDSCSELCVTPFLFDNSTNSSNLQSKSSVNKEAGIMEENSCTKYVRPKLCCGGVYVHSYRDKYESEDVVYQGEWQRYRLKTPVRWKPFAKKTQSVIKKKKVSSKEKIPEIDLAKLEMTAEPKKPLQMRRAMLIKSKQGVVKIEPNRKLAVTNNVAVTRPIRPIKNVKKISSKLALCTKSSKTTKTTYTGKRPTVLASVAAANRCCLDKEVEQPQKILNKCYIPLYLRRRNAMKLKKPNKDFLNHSIDTIKMNIKVNREKPVSYVSPLLRSKTEEIKKNLLKFHSEPQDNLNYMVFHNEIDNKGGPSGGLSNTQNNLKKIDNTNNTPHSPPSINSSTCSSPNSVATVRVICRRLNNSSTKGNSTPSHKSKLVESGSANTTPIRTKKFTKRCKSAKKTDGKVTDKENIPEIPRNIQSNKESDKVGKSVFITSNKSVFMAHLKTESTSLQNTVNTATKHKTLLNKSTVKNPYIEHTRQTDNDKPISMSVSNNISVNSENSFHIKNKEDEISEYNTVNSDLVLVTGPQVQAVQEKTQAVPLKIASNIVLAEWMDTNKNIINSHTSSILNAMRQLVDETLDFIDCPYSNDMSIDSETVILSHEDMSSSIDDSLSPTSLETVITNEDISNVLLEQDIENALNRTFDTTLGDESISSATDTKLTLTDLDLMSFKSTTSVSKFSEYYLADSEFTSHTPNTTSVRELFERKDTLMKQTPAGAIASQAFSGFSINSDPVVGDQPDYVNLIDSETGSLAKDIARRTTSEELFVSGRSSDSYESCLIDEDAVVPNWLFHIISHQQSLVEESEPSELAPMPLELSIPLALPIPEPIYDTNGNELEAGGGGAGDGCGIHSDTSQDSSGRGTSLSSSATSSGQQSEAILIDPFTGQLELLREQSVNSIVIPPPPAHLSSVMEAVQNEILNAPHEGPTRNHPLLPSSDVDADVSSLDTDVLDSSDN